MKEETNLHGKKYKISKMKKEIINNFKIQYNFLLILLNYKLIHQLVISYLLVVNKVI